MKKELLTLKRTIKDLESLSEVSPFPSSIDSATLTPPHAHPLLASSPPFPLQNWKMCGARGEESTSACPG